MNLREASLKELVVEVTRRQNVRTIDLVDGEGYRIIASGPNGLHERYLRGTGKSALVIEVNEM